VTKIIKEIGLCPVTNEPLSLDDLVEVAAPSVLAGVKPAAAGSIPSLLAALQSEYDASALETYSLRKTLQETRQELSQTLYQLDAAVRVVARVVRERDEYRRLAEEGGGGGGGVTSDAGKPHSNAGKKKAAPADGGPAKKKVKTSGGLPEQVRGVSSSSLLSLWWTCSRSLWRLGMGTRLSVRLTGGREAGKAVPHAEAEARSPECGFCTRRGRRRRHAVACCP